MNKKIILIVSVLIITSFILLFAILDSYNKQDPDYIKKKIIELEEMPCEIMSNNHHHEIDDPEHYSVYDRKFIECFGYLP